jgi:hypothetical protein
MFIEVAGRDMTVEPATAGAWKVTLPEVSPEMTTLDII